MSLGTSLFFKYFWNNAEFFWKFYSHELMYYLHKYFYEQESLFLINKKVNLMIICREPYIRAGVWNSQQKIDQSANT